jgi:hypothetical protein
MWSTYTRVLALSLEHPNKYAFCDRCEYWRPHEDYHAGDGGKAAFCCHCQQAGATKAECAVAHNALQLQKAAETRAKYCAPCKAVKPAVTFDDSSGKACTRCVQFLKWFASVVQKARRVVSLARKR